MYKLLIIILISIGTIDIFLVLAFLTYKILNLKNNKKYKIRYEFYKKQAVDFLINNKDLSFLNKISNSDKVIILDICNDLLKYSAENAKEKILKIIWLLKIEEKIFKALETDITYIVALNLYRIGKYRLLIDSNILTEFLKSKNFDINYSAFYSLKSLYGEKHLKELLYFMSNNWEQLELFSHIMIDLTQKCQDELLEFINCDDFKVQCVSIFLLSMVSNDTALKKLESIFNIKLDDDSKIILLKSLTYYKYIECQKIILNVIKIGEEKYLDIETNKKDKEKFEKEIDMSQTTETLLLISNILSKSKTVESVDFLKKLSQSSERVLYISSISSLFKLGDIAKQSLAEIKFGDNLNKRSVVLNNEKVIQSKFHQAKDNFKLPIKI